MIRPCSEVVSFDSMSARTAIVVDDMAKIQPKKAPLKRVIPNASVQMQHVEITIPAIAAAPPPMATPRTLAKSPHLNSTPRPNNKNVAPSCASVST